MKVCKFLVAFIAAVWTVDAAQISGRCVAVADGDTITIELASGVREKVRFWGIDAPEKTQAHGKVAKKYLTDMVLNKTVRAEFTERDRYGRIVGKVMYGEMDANLEMVKSGNAWHYIRYAPDATEIRDAEARARQARIGLWAGDSPVAPWVYRHPHPDGHYTAGSGNSDAGTVKIRLNADAVQYWVSSTGKVHNPGCRYYQKGAGHLTTNPNGPNCKICGGKG